ncbi:MAG TPA: flagellar hook-associated protein FlgL [Solirubrobacteraceae bacterium]|nr:flagellar hook-associated protein FlgL [Solirubrobacteraceae bacterium]
MERITTLMTQQRTLDDLSAAFNRLSTAQEQLSSGKRINKPSDDPYGAGQAVLLNGDLAGLTSYLRNVNDGTAWGQASDSAMMDIGNMVQRVRELLVKAGNDSNDPTSRADIAAEIDQLTDAIKQEADTKYGDQYIFAGTANATAPYQTGAVDTYGGNGAAITRQIGPGASVQINTDISQLLGSGQAAADGKLLNTLRDISQHLQGGTAADANALRTTDLQDLDANLDTLTTLQAGIGSTLNRLELASTRIQDLQTSQTKLLSQTQDADFAKTATDFSTAQNAYNAALRASANIVQSSLLDFLH